MIYQKAFLVDLDNTLINTDQLKELLEQNFLKLVSSPVHVKTFWESYDEIIKEQGFVNITQIAAKLSQKLSINAQKIEEVFYHLPFKESLIPKAPELLEYLRTLGKVIIFSWGEQEFQKLKLDKSSLTHIVGEENIVITQDKKTFLKELITALKDQGISNINIIDDKADVLDTAFLLDKKINCYWVRFGKYNQLLPTTSCITFQSDKLADIYDYIYTNNTIAHIQSSKNPENLKIKLGISPNQIRQLIMYTNKDKEIQKYTSDLERFRNLESFLQWLNKGKYIYTLVDSRDNLLGIVWFNEKDLPQAKYLIKDLEKFHITSGIRIYSYARGKGLSKQLMQTCLKHFQNSPAYQLIKNHGIWDIISIENIPSIKLHDRLGFQTVTKPDNQGKIVTVLE